MRATANCFIGTLVSFLLPIFAVGQESAAPAEDAAPADDQTASAPATADTGVRTWTSSGGQSLEAEFVSLVNGMVNLKKADGTTPKIALKNLCAADQEIATKLAAAVPAPGPKKLGSMLSSTSDGTLTDEEIASLKDNWTDPASGKILEFSSNFGSVKPPPGEERKYQKTGKIPVRLTAALYEVDGKARKRMSGKCRFYVLDSDQNVVIKRSESLDIMCPS